MGWLIAAAFAFFAYRFWRSYKGQASGEKKQDPIAFEITAASSAVDDQNDNWEGAFYGVDEHRSLKRKVKIRYVDGKGSYTERQVDIRAFEPNNPQGLIIGHCHLRGATRTFRFDRLGDVTDLDTGEVIPDLQKHLNTLWGESPEPVMDALARDHKDALRMLLFMAKADGAMRAKEVDVIAKFCVEATGDVRLSSTLVKDLLQYVDTPSLNVFNRAYNALRRANPEEAEKVASACRAIVATQSTVHPIEQAALDILDRPLPKEKR